MDAPEHLPAYFTLPEWVTLPEGFTVVHSIPVSKDEVVEVLGSPDNASYTWWVRSRADLFRMSKHAWKEPWIALLDGLSRYAVPGCHEGCCVTQPSTAEN